MIKRKFKNCVKCGRFTPIFSKGRCSYCTKMESKKLKKPPKTRIKRVSEKQKNLLNQYSKVRAEFLRENPCCVVGLAGCSGCDTRLMQIHHQKGRIGGLLLDTNFFLPTCFTCHQQIEKFPEIAYKNGWSLSRLGNE